MKSLELFAGAGGLAMGMSRAGFKHAAVIEWNKAACETFRDNQRHHTDLVEGWPIHEMDASQFDYGALAGRIDVVSGGPPCQPFSMGGKHRAHEDPRDMFPVAVGAIRDIMPKAFIFENVRGLTRSTFAGYFSYILLQLQHPEIVRRAGEDGLAHQARLEREHTASNRAPTYNVVFDVLNAADFGVPQCRERVFLVGFRSDLGASWSFPDPTHSRDELLRSKFLSGEYWRDHDIGSRGALSDRAMKALERRSDDAAAGSLGRWRTVRDALSDLPDPRTDSARLIANHDFTPGARVYKGHTGSRLDEPAKTLKAGQHGVPGGENMFVQDVGGVRYFTVREAARLQTFPDQYSFPGVWTETMRQLGNAVPVTLAEVMARSIVGALRGAAKEL